MSREQREALDELVRDGPLDLGGDVSQQRAIFDEMMAAIPVPDDVTAAAVEDAVAAYAGLLDGEAAHRRSRSPGSPPARGVAARPK
ncbi:MAG TPA: hypothetical protein VK501_26475 [Baekduia sp.]|uniref:hypothetical protein n=1 Tax=Baekduia sp. TaxID=2600305 RepID=UPI002B79D0DE|nr:hypothetical protein [Baekduia sp.]HMJ37479.1 hypothetical protein [Baekduia sp.]